MMYKIIVEDRAVMEAQNAYDYYEQQQIGLGECFKLELKRSIKQIQTNPGSFSKIKNEIRQKLLKGFPFLVVYEILKR